MSAERVAASLMLQGTGSDVGKSLLVAGLCRAYARRGLLVRPFKPQNMSNNAAVTADGGEIGRAQALQARACGVDPSVDMNPVLLKPQSEIGSQVVVQGQVWGNARAREYQSMKPALLGKVIESFERTAAEVDLVLIEGAGSPAEVNLRHGDIANMGFAEEADVPVILVADIDRGGVIASVCGTHSLLQRSEQRRLAGFIINKFRGDVRLFDRGLEIISEHTELASFGVVPYFAKAHRLPAEDAMAVSHRSTQNYATGIRVAVPVLSRIANFDDLDPLTAEPDVTVVFINPGEALPGDADLIVLPGSKSTLADLAFLRAQGWDIDIAAHLRRGGWLLGLCGGYQMLGNRVSDPERLEGDRDELPGLGLLNVDSILASGKTLTERSGLDVVSGEAVKGFEMHIGETGGSDCTRPMLMLDGKPHGARSADERVMGCYLHGLFASDAFRDRFLNRIRRRASSGVAYEAQIDSTLDALAEHLERHLFLDDLLEVATSRGSSRLTEATRSPLSRRAERPH